MCYTLFAKHTCGCPPSPVQPYYKLCSKVQEKAAYTLQGKNQEYATAIYPPSAIEQCSEPLYLGIGKVCDRCELNAASAIKANIRLVRQRSLILQARRGMVQRHLQQETRVHAGECIYEQPSIVPDDHQRLRYQRVLYLKRSVEAAYHAKNPEARAVGETSPNGNARSQKRVKRAPRSVPEEAVMREFRAKQKQEQEDEQLVELAAKTAKSGCVIL